MIEMSGPVDPHEVKAVWDALPRECHCVHLSSLHAAAEQLDRIREMVGIQGHEDVPEALGKYLLYLERLIAHSGRQP